MRDLVTREALRTMARDAAKRFRELVAAGQEIPYDVHEASNGSPLPQYVPLTERFIRDHGPALQELDSFGSACAAMESAELAGPYLEQFGIAVPPDPRKRGELAGLVFLCRLWSESTDFSLDGDRLKAAIAELEVGGEAATDEIEVVVPLRGFQMPIVRLELATAIVARADTVEVPAEAGAPEGAGGAAWEPTFLAATRVGAGEPGDNGDRNADAGARAVEAFRQLITTLRLFKAGGVGLGPYAWTRAGGDRWRRIATGAGRPRPGGYRLAEDELGDLMAFSRALAYRSTPFGHPAKGRPGMAGTLARAMSRFEAGLERNVVLEALNDYLLALRFLLEGGGPADLGLSMRVAALCAEPEQRSQTKAVVDRALALERELWSGERAPAPQGAPTPAETTVVIEDLMRAILKDAACGHLGTDLRSTADEILLADGLAAGEGEAPHRGGREEWDLPQEEEQETVEEALLGPEPVEGDEEVEPDHLEPGHVEPDQVEPGHVEPEPVETETVNAPRGQLWMNIPAEWETPPESGDDEGSMQVPEPAGRITIEPRPSPQEESVFDENQSHRPEAQPPTPGRSSQARQSRVAELLEERPAERERTADRVAYLFPRPETTEWNVREISYDRHRRAKVGAS